MAISYSSEGYKVTPQFANLGALQGLQPLDVTRKATFEPRPLAPIEVYSSRPELVAQGLAQGIQSAVSGITGGITAYYKEKSDVAKEERKYDKELLLEKAKQKTKNESFIDELKLKTAAEHGTEADLEDRLTKIDEAAVRLNFVNPSGNVVETKTEKTNKVDLSGPLPEITPAPAPAPSASTTPPAPQIPSVSDLSPIDIPEPLSSPVATQNQVTPVATPVPLSPPISPVVIQPAQPAGQAIQELTGIQPVTPQGSVVPAQVQSTRPEQPKDPKLPRNLTSYVYMPDQSSNAYQAAAYLTTPFRKVSVEESPRTKKLFLKQEDTSADVLKAQSDAQAMGIQAEDLVLKKHQNDLANQKQAMDSLEANRKIVKEDKSYRESLKESINKQSNKIDLIEDAINKIQLSPDLVGIYSQYLRGKEPIGGFNYQNIAAIAKGAGYSGPMDKIQKIVDIEESLKSIQANLGWEEFAKMKELSPTGSAGVGALTEGERQSLERIPGSLDITNSSEKLIGTLYNLRNGSIKTITNASNEVESADPTFKRPIYNSLRMNPNDESRIKSLSAGLGKATEEQKTHENYLNALEELTNLIKKRDRIKEFNVELGQTFIKIK
jgi:hypothetical protein